MRFVAGWGAAAKLQTSLGAAAKSHREVVAGLGAGTELLLAWALQRRAIGKMLLTGAAAELLTGWGAVAKLLAGAPWQRGRQGTPQWHRGCWRGALRQSRRRRRGMAVAREYQWQGNATADWHGNARNAKEPAPADGTGPSQTFGYIQAEQSLVEDFACLFLLGMRIYI